MKWIKYKFLCNVDKNILVDKKIEYTEDNLVIAQGEAYNGEYSVVEDDKTFENKPVAIEFGGTGAKTPEDARKNLGMPTIYFSPVEPTDWKNGDIWLEPVEE